jgi:cytoskeletal protein CcmA (bactofilin family)
MFGKENEMRSEESGKLSTVIAKGTKINGNIDMEGSIRVDGYIKGKVKSSETLTVGKTGVVEGEVEVKEAVVGGQIKGNLAASQRVELENKASILGDVNTRIFVIKEGGMFHGKCSMKDEEGEKAKEPALKGVQKPQTSLIQPESTKPLADGLGMKKS